MPNTMINRGVACPYDRRDDVPLTPARKAVLGIFADLTGRSGVDNELSIIDDDIRVEMADSLAGIVNAAYENTYTIPLVETEETRPDTPTWKLARELFSVVVDDMSINLLKYADHVPTLTIDSLHAVLVNRLGPALDVSIAVTDQMKNDSIWKMASEIFTSTFLNTPNEVLIGLGVNPDEVTGNIYWKIIESMGKGPYTPETVRQLNHLHGIAVTDDVGYSVAFAPSVQQFTVQTMGQTLNHQASTADSLFDAVKQASGKLG